MKIAFFISGRLTCYEQNLIPFLEKIADYEIDLFISVNGERDEYHKSAELNLSKWLKKIRYETYTIPIDFINNTHPETLMQTINGAKAPYTNLSCFYNDRKAFELISDYELENNFEYDVYSKFRPDLIFNNLQVLNFERPDKNELKIYSCIPPCQIYFWGDMRAPMCINDAFAYGNKISMERYTRTYEFILNLNQKLLGKYRINYEPCLTESIFNSIFYYPIKDEPNYLDDKNLAGINVGYHFNDINKIIFESDIKIQYFDCPYTHNNSRRSRDVIKNLCNI